MLAACSIKRSAIIKGFRRIAVVKSFQNGKMGQAASNW